MAGLTPLPLTIVHSSTRLTHAQAHARLSAFLENAKTDAAYRPDSILTDRGPQSTSTGVNPNLKLHHLHRILKGIEGKKIGGEVVGKFFGEGARLNEGKRKKAFDGAEKSGSEHAGEKHSEDQGLWSGMAVKSEQDK